MNEYNTFLDRNESTGYKFYWENKNVYIIEMANMERGILAVLLDKYFEIPNNGAMLGPIVDKIVRDFLLVCLVFGL